MRTGLTFPERFGESEVDGVQGILTRKEPETPGTTSLPTKYISSDGNIPVEGV